MNDTVFYTPSIIYRKEIGPMPLIVSIADFTADCGEVFCDELIQPGDEIVFSGEGPVHRECA